jgi:hypothetical protein
VISSLIFFLDDVAGAVRIAYLQDCQSQIDLMAAGITSITTVSERLSLPMHVPS